MGKLNLSRRTFAKLTAATAATAVVGCAVPGAALAEDAEAPSRGSEIKRVRTCCRGCGKMECGVWVTVENGRAIKSEGDSRRSNRRAITAARARRPFRRPTIPIVSIIR